MRRQHQFSHIIELNCFASLYGFLYVTSIKHVDHVPSLASITRVSAQNPLRNWIVKSEEKMLKEKEKERKNKWYSNGKEKLKEFCSFFFFFHASKKSRRINRNHTHTHKNRANHLITAAGSTHSRQTDFRQEIYLSIYPSGYGFNLSLAQLYISTCGDGVCVLLFYSFISNDFQPHFYCTPAQLTDTQTKGDWGLFLSEASTVWFCLAFFRRNFFSLISQQ